MDYAILAVVVVLALLEGTHAALVERIGSVKPELRRELGRAGPGYWFFGAYRAAPMYRRLLFSGRLRAELGSHPKLLTLLSAEQFLLLVVWVPVACVVFLSFLSAS